MAFSNTGHEDPQYPSGPSVTGLLEQERKLGRRQARRPRLAW